MVTDSLALIGEVLEKSSFRTNMESMEPRDLNLYNWMEETFVKAKDDGRL